MERIRREHRTGGLGLAAIVIAGGFLAWYATFPTPVHGTSPSISTNPTALQSKAGSPLWPWMPNGVNWVGPHFHVVPYTTKVVNDSSLPQGQVLVIHPGHQGVVYSVGKSSSVVLPPVPATVAKGTAVVHALFVHGKTYHYDRVLTALTTAYNGSYAMNGRWGAVAAWDGKPLHYGDVAVDPSVIPLGTYLYIDGYGVARAVDTGSAIWGDHVDLFFPESAWRIALYGIQYHKVYVLTGNPAVSAVHP